MKKSGQRSGSAILPVSVETLCKKIDREATTSSTDLINGEVDHHFALSSPSRGPLHQALVEDHRIKYWGTGMGFFVVIAPWLSCCLSVAIFGALGLAVSRRAEDLRLESRYHYSWWA